MALSHRLSTIVAPLLLAALAGTIAAGVNRLAPASEGVRIVRAGAGYGNPLIRTGGNTFPRDAVDSDGYVVRVARPARRIVSQYWSIDEFLYSVVPPERVVAVSESAYQPRISNVYRYVKQFRPVISNDIEKVLRLDPDLIMVSNSSRADFCALVRNAGIPIYRAFTMVTTLDQVAETIRLTGYLTGEEKAAEAELTRFRAAIERARALRPPDAKSPRILGFGGKFSYGDETLFHDIVQVLGGINVSAEGGLKGYNSVNSEQIVRWNPEWIIAGAERGKTKEMLAHMLADPAIALTQAARDGRILVFEQNVFLSMSPFCTLLVTALSEALYGSGSGARQ